VSLKPSITITSTYLSTVMFNSIHSRLQLTLKQGLTPNLLTITIVAPPSNASKWQIGFNSAFKWLKKARLERDIQARVLSFQIRQSSKLSTNCESLFRSRPVRRHGFYLHEPVSWSWKGRGGVGGYIGENSQCPTFNREIKINEWLNTLSQTSGQKPSNQPPEFRSQRVHTKAKL